MTLRRAFLSWPLLLLFSAPWAGMAGAANLQISPVTLTMRAEQTAAGITLQNLGEAPLFGQVRVFLWDQANGEEALAPTQELVASPPIVEIAANSRQTIRLVRTQAGTSAQERTYRVLIDEVGRDDDPARSGVDIRLRYSVPVFVLPSGMPGKEFAVSKGLFGYVLAGRMREWRLPVARDAALEGPLAIAVTVNAKALVARNSPSP